MVSPRLQLLLVGVVRLFFPQPRVGASVVALELFPGALLAPESVVRVADGVLVEGEEPPEFLLGHGGLLEGPLAVDDVLQRLLRELSLEHLLLDGSGGEQPVQVALLLLPVAPASSRRLLVVGRVPVRIEEHQSVAADEVDAAPARLAGEQKHKRVRRRVVELLHQLLALRDGGAAVQTHRRVVTLPAQQLHQVQRLRVVADDHHPVLGLRAKDGEESSQHGKLSRVKLPTVHHPSRAAASPSNVVHPGLEKLPARFETRRALSRVLRPVDHVVDELRVVAQLLQRGDGGEHHRVLSRERRLRRLGFQKVSVQLALQRTHATAHNFHHLRGEMFRQDGVRAPEDELVDELGEFGVAVLGELKLRLGRVRFPPG